MSILQLFVFAWILKFTVEPWLTLMSVVKPWSVVDPGPLRSHWLWGVPAN